MTTERVYFPTLDGIRGVAALLVVARHCEPLFKSPFSENYLAVDAFFLLSGVVLFTSYEARLKQNLTSISFFVIRLLRLYPLYALGSALGLLVVLLHSIPLTHTLLMGVFMAPDLNLHHRDLYPFDGPAWSLFLEVVASAIYGFVGYRTTTFRLACLAGSMFLVLVLLLRVMPEHSLDLGWSSRTFVGGFVRLAFSFPLGIVLGRLAAAHKPRALGGWQNTLATWIILAMVGAILMLQPPEDLHWLYDLFVVAIAFPLIVAFALAVQPDKTTTVLCRWLGLISFPIYALHTQIHDLLQYTLNRFGTAESLPTLARVVLFYIGLIAVAAVIDALYDRPLRRWLMTYLGERSNRTAAATGTNRSIRAQGAGAALV